MNIQEIRELQEAYQAVYTPQELTEEVEIATEYFYEIGLNEHGIDILIEELGVEEFVEWVDEIAEEYTLNEATRLQKDDRKLKGPKGSRPQSTTKAREKIQGGVTMKSSEAPKSTISARKRATKAAAEKQPETQETPDQKKQGIAGRIGAALGAAVKRGREDIATTRRTAQTIGKAVRTGVDALNRASDSRPAGQVRLQVKKGLKRQQKAIDTLAPKVGGALGRMAANVPAIADTFRAGQKLGRALKAEEYDYILSHLLDEGYANDLHGAEVILMNMSENWALEVLDEARVESGESEATKRDIRSRRYVEKTKGDEGVRNYDAMGPTASTWVSAARRRAHRASRGKRG
jgi:hypothetical protein